MKKAMKRLYNLKNRLYIEAKYLSEFGFSVGQSIKYVIDKDNKQISITPTKNKERRHVAKTTQRSGQVVPVIDIKSEDVREFLSKHQNIEVEIVHNKIVFTVIESISKNNVISFEDAKNDLIMKRQQSYSVDIVEYGKVVNYQQMDLFELFNANSHDIKESMRGGVSNKSKEQAIKMLSLFSGCGSLDKGFLDEGYNIVWANDRYEDKALKDYHIQTYRNNIGNHIVMRDVLEITENDIPQVDFIAAGVPCVSFSNLNTINNYRDAEADHHPLVERTLDIIKWSNCSGFLIENVERFLKVRGGIMLKRFKEVLTDFNITTNIIDATQLGSPQKRKRAFILGLKGAEPSLEVPKLAQFCTVSDAFKNIEGTPQQDLYFTPTKKTLERMKYIPQGGNINSVPVELRAPNKKFSNYCQRLCMKSQSPTITHVQDDVFIHPLLDRYLSARETARLFSLPDDYLFTGSPTAVFEMLKNCVDYKVSRYLAKIIKKQLALL